MNRTTDCRKAWDSRALDYTEKILSPLYSGVKNPIYEFVKTLNANNYKRVADMGCGRGEFLTFLAQHFEEVWGIDWSDEMLRIASEKTQEYKNVFLRNLDIKDIECFSDYFDITFTINSILPNKPIEAKQMLQEIYSSLRKGGLFIAILPSFDTVLYQRQLTYDKYVEMGLYPEEAWQRTDDYFIRMKKLDIKNGMYADDGVHLQKFFTEYEIHYELNAIGFVNISSEKVLYPWNICQKYGYGYYPGKPEIWDWFVVTSK